MEVKRPDVLNAYVRGTTKLEALINLKKISETSEAFVDKVFYILPADGSEYLIFNDNNIYQFKLRLDRRPSQFCIGFNLGSYNREKTAEILLSEAEGEFAIMFYPQPFSNRKEFEERYSKLLALDKKVLLHLFKWDSRQSQMPEDHEDNRYVEKRFQTNINEIRNSAMRLIKLGLGETKTVSSSQGGNLLAIIASNNKSRIMADMIREKEPEFVADFYGRKDKVEKSEVEQLEFSKDPVQQEELSFFEKLKRMFSE